MAAKRLVRKFTDVVAEVEAQLVSLFDVAEKDLNEWRVKAKLIAEKFPHSTMVDIDDLWIDYEVQRDVIHKHVINIMKKWDPRICSPGSACRINGDVRIFLYDAQHRTLAAAILGYTEIPCAVVDTTDPNFASWAFEMLNQTGVKRLTPGDLHRNALVRYKNGSREKKNISAYKMQKAFDDCEVDLEDKAARNNPNLRGNNDYFFSHFKYAQKTMDVEKEGNVLRNILTAITTAFPRQGEVDQGVFIGLLELQRLAGTENNGLPDDWMTVLLNSVKTTFKNSHVLHDKAKTQFSYKFPGATWSAPSAMSEFMRELHMLNGGKLKLPTHGTGACLDLATRPAPGLFPKVAA
jgi:hypothetical protein